MQTARLVYASHYSYVTVKLKAVATSISNLEHYYKKRNIFILNRDSIGEHPIAAGRKSNYMIVLEQ
jgi:hypothetical protein